MEPPAIIIYLYQYLISRFTEIYRPNNQCFELPSAKCENRAYVDLTLPIRIVLPRFIVSLLQLGLLLVMRQPFDFGVQAFASN